MAISDDDAKIRQSWQEGHKVCIFSNSRKKWFDGNVAQIFHDDEGEWLEIRYDKSMSKQVQRYSTDIKPTKEQMDDFKKKKLAEKKKGKGKGKVEVPGVPFPDVEMTVRKSWSKSDDVEIFSNTHQEWYRGEIVEIIKDDEGEWLNVVWARNNGEAMSKQVQRFSTDVRPVQDDSDSDPGGTHDMTEKYKREILARQNGNFVRNAPLFSRTIQASNFTNPASGSVRNKKRLGDIEEKDEQDQIKPKIATVEDWNETKVIQFLNSLGKAYTVYRSKFRGMKGLDLLQLDEKRMEQMGIEKLHRLKILIELAKLSNTEYSNVFENCENLSVLNWDSKRVKKYAAKQHNISQYALNLFRHGVDGMLLFELDDKDLDTIGVHSIHKKKFFDTIDELHRISFPNAPPLNRKKSNSQLDEKDEELQATSIISPKETKSSMNKTSKRRQSVIAIDSNQSMNFIRDELLLEMANTLLKIGKNINSNPEIEQSVANLEAKLNVFQTKLTTTVNNNMVNNNNNNNNNNKNNRNDFDVSVDTSLENENEDDLDVSSNGKVSKLKNRAMERLEDVESPMGLNNYRNWINTQDSKKGHRRRDSIPFVNNNSKQVSLEDENQNSDDDTNEDISDIE